MATAYYISNALSNGYVVGADINNGTSKSTPFLTIAKAMTLTLVAGDTITINKSATTYQETSGSGYLLISKNIAAPGIIIQSDPAIVSGTVTVQGASAATQSVLLQTCNNVKIQGITFVPQSNATIYTVRVSGPIATGNVVFDTCVFTALGNTSQTNFCFATVQSAGNGITGVTVNNCICSDDGTFNNRGISLVAPDAGSVNSNITLTNNTVNVTGSACIVTGYDALTAHGNTFNSNGAATSGYGILYGYDNFTFTHTSTGPSVIGGNYLSTTSGHACILGAGVTLCTVQGNRIFGGASVSAGQGVVLKNNSTNTVLGNLIWDGYNNGVYFKAAFGDAVKQNVVYSRYGAATTAGCVHWGFNSEDSSKASNNTFAGNFCIATSTRYIFTDGSSGDSGGNSENNNVIALSGTWGTQYGVLNSGTTIPQLQAGWAGSPYAGINSTLDTLTGTNSVVSTAYATTGAFLYAVALNEFGQVWNGNTFENCNPATWYRYINPMLEVVTGSCVYTTSALRALPRGVYTVVIYNAPGVFAAASDTILRNIAYDWNGNSQQTALAFRIVQQ